MVFTWIGVVQLVIGVFLLVRGSLNSMFVFMLLSSLMGGSAALLLPALGGSSITPLHFALVLVTLRVLAPKGGYTSELLPAIRENRALILFVFYGVAAAIAAPRIFAGTITVAPMRLTNPKDMYEAILLAPTSQNITTSIYLVGNVVAALIAYIVCRFRGGAHTLVKTAIILTWMHGVIGIVGALTKGTPVEDFYNLFRNASYSQLDHSYQGFVRINGIAAEASSYAALGFMWFVFNCECWFRGVMPKATGRAAVFMGAVLFFSTSSTAYIGLGAYALYFLLRAAAFPRLGDRQRFREALLAISVAIFLTAVAMATIPSLPAAIGDMVLHMTADKAGSNSGLQRTYWAMQGWHAFIASGGLGIGPGSFRSSSLIMAILGSMGIIGIVSLFYYIICFFQPHRQSTWASVPDPGLAVGGAAATTAVLVLIPASFTAPAPDPGVGFAIFAATSLALRPLRAHRPATMPPGATQPDDFGSDQFRPVNFEGLPPRRS